jgi:polysaccharide pyruvyl transferase WcaK-like protein
MAYRILGWYGRGNCGDDAFCNAFQAILPNEALSYESKFTALNPEEKLILGAGDVIKPYYLRLVPKDMPFVVVGGGLGYESEIELLRDRNLSLAILRNRRDVDLARAAGINAHYAPDICFAIDPALHDPIAFTPRSTKKRLGIILSAHATPGIEQGDMREAAYYDYLQWELAAILDYLSEYYDIYWISFSADPDAWDEGASYSVRRKMKIRSDQTFFAYRPDEPIRQLKILAEMNLVITMKFHGAIFATLCGVPFIAIGQTRKLCQYCEQEGLVELLIPKFSLERERVYKVVKDAEHPNVVAKLRHITKKNYAAVVEATGALSP